MNDNQTQKLAEKPLTSFGQRLQQAREGLGYERKDVAQQLRLSEKIIIMMEKDRYPINLPVMFIRGYLRSYGKLLEIPEAEVRKAIEHIKPKPTLLENIPNTKPLDIPVTSGNYLIQIFTYVIIFSMLGLVGTWWYTHPKQPLNPNGKTSFAEEKSSPAGSAAKEQKLTEAEPPPATIINKPIANQAQQKPLVTANTNSLLNNNSKMDHRIIDEDGENDEYYDE